MRSIFKIAILLLATTAFVDKVQAQGPGGGGPGGGMNMMQMVDTDKDGKVSLAEYTAFAQMRWGRISQGADKVTVASLPPMQQGALAGITPAADGTVSKAAYEATIPAKFKAADTNSDGSLDQAEFMSTMGGMRRPGDGN